MREHLTELLQSFDRERPCVYCSVIETRGSTPQKAGSVMLVHADGSQSGTLGGGCVEAEVKRQALASLHDPAAKPAVLTFSLDDNYGWDDGLICGGRMTMLAAPAVMADRDYYRQLNDLQVAGCTEVVSLSTGSRYLFDGAGTLIAERGESLPAGIQEYLKPLGERPKPYVHQGHSYLPTLPRITLLIVGGGHVGQAVAELASRVEFDVWALDDRDKYVSRERFPTAQRHLIGDIGQKLRELTPEIHRGCYCLIVTRGHNHDEEALYHLARTPAAYVGMIGSKRKIKLIFEDLIAKGISEEVLANIHAPLGLHIGSQTVPEIAISIVAELIATRNLGGRS